MTHDWIFLLFQWRTSEGAIKVVRISANENNISKSKYSHRFTHQEDEEADSLDNDLSYEGDSLNDHSRHSLRFTGSISAGSSHGNAVSVQIRRQTTGNIDSSSYFSTTDYDQVRNMFLNADELAPIRDNDSSTLSLPTSGALVNASSSGTTINTSVAASNSSEGSTNGAGTCPYCQKVYTHRSALKRHLRGHIGQKPYGCTICNYRAIQKSDVTRHMRVHTGERPYQCLHCPHRASQSGDLDRHVQAVHADLCLFCPQCAYKSSSSAALNSHMCKKHL